MIEVEKKFRLTPESRTQLLDGAQLISEKTFTDVYYDTADWQITTNDWWLRQRGDRFELKIRIHGGTAEMVDQYQEIDDEQGIREALKLPAHDTLLADLATNGYSPCCAVTTTRMKYQVDGFSIDIDEATAEDFAYQLAEIELMVEKQEDMPAAVASIVAFAKSRGLDTGYVRGKVLQYLKEQRPAHFQALIDAGVVKQV